MGPRWRYLLGEVVIGLRRNLLMTLATVVTVTVSLALLGTGLLVQAQVSKAQRLLYGEIEVSIFLEDSISEEQRASLERDLIATPVVDQVFFESKQQAYENFLEIFADDPSMLELVTPDQLPASFRVKLSDPEQFSVIRSRFADYPGIQENGILDQREVLENFFQLMNALRNGAIGVALLQLVGAAALISNTIRVTAFARREQTGIMKLVGATNWYIRLPFVLEGIVAGVAGALTAGILLLIGEATLLSQIREQVPSLPFINTGDVLATIPILVVIAVVIASLSSVLALRRFLAV
jgi:cell division transport system permease protein